MQKYSLAWGIHRGTLMSRDQGETFHFDTEDELLKKWNEIKEWFTGPQMQMQIWFASIRRPGRKKTEWETLEHGNPYR